MAATSASPAIPDSKAVEAPLMGVIQIGASNHKMGTRAAILIERAGGSQPNRLKTKTNIHYRR